MNKINAKATKRRSYEFEIARTIVAELTPSGSFTAFRMTAKDKGRDKDKGKDKRQKQVLRLRRRMTTKNNGNGNRTTVL
jgi:hypothetical protein